MAPEILLRDYTYTLPDDRIALMPLGERDHSKLLVYRDQAITHSRFDHLSEFLPDNAILFFNDTKVIPARVIFTKDTGAEIELFLLNPVRPLLVQRAMQSTGSVEWQCTIGNLKRWTEGKILTKQAGERVLYAEMVDRSQAIVRLSWNQEALTFAEIIQNFGAVPLPPYIKREAEAGDKSRYQTVYSQAEGAVAAPTAGLHFSKAGVETLTQKGIVTDFLTLHVSAGTFQPVKVENAYDHTMHTEQVIVTRRNIENLLQPGKKIVAVGTTSLRTLESIYWYGVILLGNPQAPFQIAKLDPYQLPSNVPEHDAFNAVLQRMNKQHAHALTGETSILILPGYPFKTAEILITNFHQPGSTLMLLVAAFVGENWRKIYEEALAKDYRFLSYGDSSLLFRV